MNNGLYTKPELTVVKAGGEVFLDNDTYEIFLDYFYSLPGLKVLPHGAGKQVDNASEFYGQKPEKYAGKRVTKIHDLTMLLKHTSVLNTKIVYDINNIELVKKVRESTKKGYNYLDTRNLDIATGIPPVDSYVYATKRPVQMIEGKPVDFQYVGDLDDNSINVELLRKIIDGGKIPVIPPTAYALDINAEVNINADSVAAMTAAALNKYYDVTLLLYCANVPGVMRDINDKNSVIPQIDKQIFEELKRVGIVEKGMIQKIKCALMAKEMGVNNVRINGQNHVGTKIR